MAWVKLLQKAPIADRTLARVSDIVPRPSPGIHSWAEVFQARPFIGDVVFPLGLLGCCLERARDGKATAGGVFAAIRKSFTDLAAADFATELNAVKDFRNKYIARVEVELMDRELARKQLRIWLNVLVGMHGGDRGQ